MAACWADPKVVTWAGSLAGKMARPLIDATVDSKVDLTVAVRVDSMAVDSALSSVGP